jgi:hypothetical protein
MEKKVIDINQATIHKYVASIRPEDLEIRKQVDIGYSYDGKVALLFEIRPNWLNPEEIDKIEFAKIRYYKSKKLWNLYWMRAGGKWELYTPFSESTHLGEIIKTIKEDKNACFFG